MINNLNIVKIERSLMIIICLFVIAKCSFLSWFGGCHEKFPSEDYVYAPEAGGFMGNIKCRHREFLGIPYAKPPIDSSRWKSPEPLEAKKRTDSPIDAKEFKNHCVQLISGEFWSRTYSLFFGLDSNKESEDCLYLNIYTPRLKKYEEKRTSKFPVLVYIHGGVFSSGSGSMSFYNASNWVKEVEDLVIITINYRLGLFGFLGWEENGNFGLQDQIMALRWIQKNIEYFGGNPENVTLIGQSAGAISIQYLQHALRHEETPLFHQTVLMGGTMFAIPPKSLEPDGICHRAFEILVKNFECSGESPLECLRNVPWKKITRYAQSRSWDYVFGPVLEGKIINEMPHDIYLNRSKHRVPTLFTTCANEGSFFAVSMLLKGESLRGVIEKLFKDSEHQSKIIETYQVGRNDDYETMTEMITDAQFQCPARRLLKSQNPHIPAFYYQFRKGLPVLKAMMRVMYGYNMGVMHGSDIVILFNSLPWFTFPFQGESKRIQRLISDFAHTGKFSMNSEDSAFINNGIESKCKMWDEIGPFEIPLDWHADLEMVMKNRDKEKDIKVLTEALFSL